MRDLRGMNANMCANGQAGKRSRGWRKEPHGGTFRIDGDLIGNRQSPQYGHRAACALLVRSPHGNVLWDSAISLVDAAMGRADHALGGLKAIAISTRIYTTMVDGSALFGNIRSICTRPTRNGSGPDPASRVDTPIPRDRTRMTVIRTADISRRHLLHWAQGASARARS